MRLPPPMPNDTIQGELESPSPSDEVSGALAVKGWALSDSGIRHVDIFIDSCLVGPAHYGVPRTDPPPGFAEVAGATRCGFFHLVDLSPYSDGLHHVEARAESASGKMHSWSAGFRVVPSQRYVRWVENSTRIYSERAESPSSAGVHFLLLLALPDEVEAKAVHETLVSLARQYHVGFELHIVAGPNCPTELERILVASGYTGECRILAVADDEIESTLFAGLSSEVIGLLRPGAILLPWALSEVAASFASDETIDLIYGDEDKIDGNTRFDPVFKPAWSPVFLTSLNYVGDVWFARRSTLKKASESSTRSSILHDRHDLLQRVGAEARRVCHIPTVLHSLGPGTPARSSALTKRTSIKLSDVENWPKVSVIIPTRLSDTEIISACFSSLIGITDYPDLEIIVVLNNLADDAPVADFSRKWPVRTLQYSGLFNWSAINNEGVRHAGGDYLLFMNDDVEVLHADWLKVMVGRLLDTGAAASGPLLLYPNRTVQHAGVNLVYTGGSAHHLFRFFSLDESHARWLARCPREVAAVTGACLLVKRHVFDLVGGFDEKFALVSNDIDFCLRLAQTGYVTLFESDASLIHHEGVSRAGMAEMDDVLLFWERWESTLRRGDPWWNPNLDFSCDNWIPDPDLWDRPAPRIVNCSGAR